MIYGVICFKRFVEATHFIDKHMFPLLIIITLRLAAKFGTQSGDTKWDYPNIVRSLCSFDKKLLEELSLDRINQVEMVLLETLDWKICHENILNEEFLAWANWLRAHSRDGNPTGVTPFSVLTNI